MPLQATSGAASYDAFGGGVPVIPNYIEDVFSTTLYTGNGSTQTITNNIDLSTKGGLVWIKARNSANEHSLEDTLRTVSIYAATLSSNTTDAQSAGDITGFTTSGFSLRDYTAATNSSGTNYASWTFRKQPKFFDVVTWTGDGVTTGRTIAHSLNSAVGALFAKCTSNPSDWPMWHNTFTGLQGMYLNTTDGKTFNTFESKFGNGTTVVAPTSTVFTVGIDNNVSGRTYVAYIFAHNAGGFGLTGTDNVISCGSFTANGSGTASVNLSYEPQWVMFKRSDSATFGDWAIFDNMRGLPSVGSGDTAAKLFPNTSAAENAASGDIKITSTGFNVDLVPSATYIYIAIRRGPMKVPTSGTSVFDVDLAGNASAPSFTSAFPVDLGFIFRRSGDDSWYWVDRLRGTPSLSSDTTAAEASFPTLGKFDYMNGYGSSTTLTAYTGWNFRRAPSFFDEVCYTGTGVNRTIAHNLTVAPELVIIKSRSNAVDWVVGNTSLGFANFLMLNRTDASGATSSIFNNTAPTSSVFSVGASSGTNEVTLTYVAYLFATCAGISKVGSYTGTATTKQIDCGFTGGARFVLIKRTDATGAWYVWDSARGIVSGNDSYLLLNSTAAEVTNTDYIDTYSAGFEISSTAPAAINASGGSFIFFAVA